MTQMELRKLVEPIVLSTDTKAHKQEQLVIIMERLHKENSLVMDANQLLALWNDTLVDIYAEAGVVKYG